MRPISIRRPEKPVPSQHKQAQKEQTPVGERHTIKPTVKLGFRVSGRAGRLPIGRPATLAHSGRSPGHPTRMKNNRTVKLYVIARGQRGQNRRLQPFAGGGSGLTATRTINRRVFIDAIHQNRRLSRSLRALRPGVCSDGVSAKPNGESILTLRFLAQVRSLRGIGYLQPGSSAERHRASREEASGPPANTET